MSTSVRAPLQDPAEFRLRNMIGEGEEDAIGARLHGIKAREVLQAALNAAGWDRPKPGAHGASRARRTKHHALGNHPDRIADVRETSFGTAGHPSGLAGGARNLDDFGGDRDEKDHLDDVGVS